MILSTAVLALLVGAAVAMAANTVTLTVQAVPNKASTRKKIRPIKLAINVGITDPTQAQPTPLKQVIIRFNKGGVFNGKLFPKCKKAALVTKGPKGCPKGSKVGSGTATASAKPIVDNVNAKVTIFNGAPLNGKPSVLLYNVPDISSPIIVQGTVEKKPVTACGNGGQCDYVLTFNVDPIPTLPNAPDASVTSVKTSTGNVFVKKKKRGKTVKIPYIGAPKVCNGTWAAEGQVTFVNGEVVKVPVSAPCKK
jgi:hypothetical protein